MYLCVCTEIKQFKAKSNADYLKQIHIICKDKYTTFDDNVDIKMQYVNHLLSSYVELISIDGNYEYFAWTRPTLTLFAEITDRLHNIVENYSSDLTSGSIIWNLE